MVSKSTLENLLQRKTKAVTGGVLSLFLIKFEVLRPATLLKKTTTNVLSCETC